MIMEIIPSDMTFDMSRYSFSNIEMMANGSRCVPRLQKFVVFHEIYEMGHFP